MTVGPDLPTREARAVHAEGLDGWHRLHPLSPVARAGRSLIAVLVIALPRLLSPARSVTALLIDLGFAAVAVLLGVVSWLVTRWRVEGADLLLESGLLRRSSRRYPLRQVQAIDLVQSGVSRVLGLAELRLRMAGDGRAGRLASLRLADAEQLRAQLLALPATHAPPVSVDEHPAPERAADPVMLPAPLRDLVLVVPNGRLLASVALSGGGVLVVVLLAALVVGTALDASAAAAALTSSGAIVIGLATALYRRVNGGWGFTLSRSEQGLHIESGLVQTSSETVPAGRVQALRVVEPLLWRPFGWCLVEAGVAGKRSRNEERPEGSSRRLLVPVGTYAEAHAVVRLVVGASDPVLSKPPPRARWKTPLAYHRLAIGTDGQVAVATSGRLRRVSHWVPLEKVQSIRRTQGPLQRRLRLATVHLDTAGPRQHAALRDRDVAEAEDLLGTLPDACRAARTQHDGPV